MTEIPLVELHIHLEGSIRPERLLALAERYGQATAARGCLDETGKFFPPADFRSFLSRFKLVTSLLRTPLDYHHLALDAAADLAREGVVYAEMTVGYGVMHRWGVDPLPVQRALYEAAAQSREETGVVLRWQADAVRQFGPAAAWRDLEAACLAGRELGVVGFGVGGDEDALPAGEFAAHLSDAAAEGLGTTLHAGETGRPEAVAAALAAGARRIGHATAAGERPELLAQLAAAGVFAELCPGSNVATGGLPRFADHPLPAFLAAGVDCCLNTDDPTLFGLTLRGEYARARAAFALDDATVAAMQRRALAAAFCGESLKKEIGARLMPDPDGGNAD
jgi:adenosine deaminase